MEKLSPKEFMKGRKPHKFSDSIIVKSATLNRSILDQHLETLTTRNQENDFAEFARKLCEFEIMPNLRPQTGPVGGGDSKVDSENILVSDQIQISYSQGEENQSKELFAFAFSAKKKWADKVKSDIRKIRDLEKKYTRAYFVTNQAAKDKTRSEIEDELTQECKMKVIILDKTWILDRVFTNKREHLAIEQLRMGSGLEETLQVGPLDIERRRKLDEINKDIEDAVSQNRVNFSIVSESINAAILTRELCEPRVTFDGQFERAIRFSKEYGNDEHLFTALYERAWGTFFWYEDFKAFLNYYEEIEKLAIKSGSILSLERLSNLWSLLDTISTKLNIDKDTLEQRLNSLKLALNKVVENEANPSTAIHAEAILCLIEINIAQREGEEIGNHFIKLRDILGTANNLIGFPFETIIALLGELDVFYSGIKEYEELQESLVDIITKRRGEIPAGKIFLERGVQHLKAQRFYPAINYFGRALIRLYKKESEGYLVRTLLLLSSAYEEIGLLWAARGALLSAASQATSDFWKYNEINTLQLVCYEHLKLVELKLGRMGPILDWHKTHLAMAQQLAVTNEETEDIIKKSMYFGNILGLLTIKTKSEDLKALEKLPDIFSELFLDFAGLGLAYRLGGKDNLPDYFPEDLCGPDPEGFFSNWLTQPAQEDLPAFPDYYLTSKVELHSSALGCSFIITTTRESPNIDIAEFIAAAIESFLSTSAEIGAFSHDSLLKINVSRNDNNSDYITHKVSADGIVTIDVECTDFNPHSLSREQQDNIGSKIAEIVFHAIAYTIHFENSVEDIKKLEENSQIFTRSISLSSPLIRLGNVLGHNPRRSILDWISENSKTYNFVVNGCKLQIPSTVGEEKKVNDTHQGNDFSHSEMLNTSIIRMHLWDKARWYGVAYLSFEDIPPILALTFENEEAARNIFLDWQKSIGKKDMEDKIRLTILRGVEADHPDWYRLGISANGNKENIGQKKILSVTRIHTMHPENSKNLDQFLEFYNKYKCFQLAPCFFKKGETSPTVLFELRIAKRQLIVRHAWQIKHDEFEDLSLITSDTKPYIPARDHRCPHY